MGRGQGFHYHAIGVDSVAASGPPTVQEITMRSNANVPLMIPFIAVPLVMLAAACAEPAPDAAPTEAAATPLPTETAVMTGDDSGAAIPVALHGRWGLVAADCTSTRGDAKGLMEVSGDGVTFYESRGTAESASAVSDTGFRGNFAMTGEGMEWNREMALTLSEDGQSLVRSEFGEDALAEPLTYSKCA